MKTILILAAAVCFAVSTPTSVEAGGNQNFVRADCNVDSQINIADAIALLGFLFSGASVDCDDACDVNDDGGTDIADAITLLGILFSGSPDPAAPFPDCGMDATPDSLDCASFDQCVTAAPLSLATDIQPILDARCIGCHVPGGQGEQATGLSLIAADSFAHLVGTAASQVATLSRIAASDPQNSYLWHKINGTQASVGGFGEQMPRGGPPLDQAQLDLIEQWINEGANP